MLNLLIKALTNFLFNFSKFGNPLLCLLDFFLRYGIILSYLLNNLHLSLFFRNKNVEIIGADNFI